MPDTVITVRGSHTSHRPAERATVRLRVGLEGASAQQVFQAVADSAAAVSAGLVPLHDPEAGPITWWSSDQVRTWARRPWNQDGKQLPIVHHAQTRFEAKFKDFAALGRWVSAMVEVTGVSVEGIDWALTEVRRVELAHRARTAAVRDAVDKAQSYADALDLGRVAVLAVADAGMLGEGLHPVSGAGVTMSSRASAGGGEDLSFTPQDIAVSAEVDARFAVG